MELVSAASDGSQGNNYSTNPNLSPDARYVVFESLASNLVSDDTNATFDIFVHDRQTGITERISVASDGSQGNDLSHEPGISADGRYISFHSLADNLVVGDTNEVADVFVHDRETGNTLRVSISSDGTQGDLYSAYPAISANGCCITFYSEASNLVSGDTNENWDIFVHDQLNGTTTRVSVSSDGTQAIGNSYYSDISADGHYIAFHSDANNLVEGDNNYNGDIFIRDLANLTTSYSISGRITDGDSEPIDDVNLSAGSATTLTDANGYYTFTNLITGTYGITPTKLGYSFTPVSRLVVVPPDALNQDFAATPTGTDLLVDHIEVRQTFVSDNDPIVGYDIPLIANKASMVRIYIGVLGTDSVDNVTAHLYIQEDSGQIHEMVHPIGMPAIVARSTSNPLDLSSTINFSPLPQWLQGDVTIWAVVDPDNLVSESNESNNTSMESIIQFHPNNSLRIAWVTFDYRPFLLTDYVDNDIAARGDQYLSKVYPVGSANLDYFYQPGFYQVMTQKHTSNAQDYIQALRRFWGDMRPEDWVGGVTPDRLFGWYPASARDPGSGCGNGPGPVALGPDYCDKEFGGTLEEVPEDQVFAHEIGHTLGLPHTPNDDGNPFCLGDVDGADDNFPRYPGYPWGSIGIHGLDVIDSRIHYPFSTYDFMSYCQNWWMSTYNYKKLDEALIQMNSKPPDTFQAPERQLLVSGYLFTPTLSVEFDPFYAITSTTGADISTGTEYCIEMRDNASTPIDSRCFDLGFRDQEEGTILEYEGFSLAVPYPISTTQIALTHAGIPLELVNVSLHSPQVILTYPNGGETWSATATYTITWNSSDLDGEALFHKLYYSANGGISWVPVAYDIPKQSNSMDVSNLPGGSQILLRIAVTDGVNTSYDESDGFISVGKKQPTAIVNYPEPGKTILPGTAIVFKGKGYDLEDGTLIDTQLIWSSNIDGYLGNGREVIAILSPGLHIVTLSVTDNDGISSTTDIQVFVGRVVYMPLLKK